MENPATFKRQLDLSCEILRLEMILRKNFLTKKMYKKVLLKLKKLEQEKINIFESCEREILLKFLKELEKKEEPLLESHKFRRCENCYFGIVERYYNYCSDCDEDLNSSSEDLNSSSEDFSDEDLNSSSDE